MQYNFKERTSKNIKILASKAKRCIFRVFCVYQRYPKDPIIIFERIFDSFKCFFLLIKRFKNTRTPSPTKKLLWVFIYRIFENILKDCETLKYVINMHFEMEKVKKNTTVQWPNYYIFHISKKKENFPMYSPKEERTNIYFTDFLCLKC